MTDEPSPRPWRLEDGFECEIVDATGRHVLTATSRYAVPPLGDEREAANAALIVEAVNAIEATKKLSIQLYNPIRRAEDERDRLRDIVRRLYQMCCEDWARTNEAGRALLREARKAIGKDKP